MGRKKIVIRPIENKAARDVYFSKRRNGLFTKTNDLAVMCGAEVVAVAYSPAGKAFSFAHPSAEDIINRFLPAPEQAGAAAAGTGAAVDRDRLEELQREYNKLCAEQAAVEQRKERWGEATAKDRAEGSQAAAWLDAVADQRGMGDADMLACMAKLREAQLTVAVGVNQVLEDGRRDKEAALAALPPQLLAGGGGFELGCPSANSGMENFQQQPMMTAMPQLPGHAGGYGFEFGGTSADGGTYEQQMMMTATPPPPGFAAGMEMMQQQQQQQMMSAMPTPPGFAPGMEMQQQQQQQMLTALPPLPVFAAGTEMMHQVFGPYDKLLQLGRLSPTEPIHSAESMEGRAWLQSIERSNAIFDPLAIIISLFITF